MTTAKQTPRKEQLSCTHDDRCAYDNTCGNHKILAEAECELAAAEQRAQEVAAFHAILDECGVSRRYSLDAGKTWLEHSVVARLRIIVAANKTADQDIEQAEEKLAKLESAYSDYVFAIRAQPEEGK